MRLAAEVRVVLTWDEALRRVVRRTPVMPQRRVPLESAAGFVLAEPVVARHDSPPFDTSAVDGFAVYGEDVAAASKTHPVRLRLAGTAPAGEPAGKRLRRGTAVKILTGGCVPRGAEAIVMQEDCREEKETVIVRRSAGLGDHIRPRGGEFRKGQTVLPPGLPITPPVAGLLATCGYASVRVFEKPAVTIVVTGDELMPPSRRLRPGKIHDANTFALAAAVQMIGIQAVHTMRSADQPARLKHCLSEALGRSDVLLTVGGMSVGDHDHVRGVLDELGVREDFWRIAVKPGKPVYFGRWLRKTRTAGLRRNRDGLVFGLPGNPVSALVCFHQLVKPALWKLMGRRPPVPTTLGARLVGERRKSPGRLEWVRGVLSCTNGVLRVQPTSGQDSHMLSGLAQANCLIRFPADASHLAENADVLVELLSWSE